MRKGQAAPTPRERRKRRTMLFRELRKNLDHVDALKDELRDAQGRTSALLRQVGAMVEPVRRKPGRKPNGAA